ncbi:MAG TPA: PAS domain S-box protein [Drouetiella sp.]
MKLKLTLAQKGMIAVSTMLLFQLAFIGAVAKMLDQAGKDLEHEAQVRQIIAHLNSLTGIWNQTTIGLTRVVQHGWLSGETAEQSEANPEFQQEYYKQPQMVHTECLVLRRLTKDDPTATAALNDIDNYCKTGLYMMEKVRMCAFNQNPGEQYSWLAKLRNLGNQTVDREQKLLRYYTEMEDKISEEQAKNRQNTSMLMVALVAFDVLIAFIFALLFTKGITGRVNRLIDNSLRLAAHEPLRARMKGSDEIAKLDRTFHEVADTLEQARQKERAIVDNATDLICSIGKDGRFSAVNPAVETMLGFAPDELLGQRFIQIVVDNHRNDLRNYLDQVMRTGNAQPFELQLLRKDSQQIFAVWSAQWSEKEQTWFCVVHDISERKREENLIRASEERIRSVIENLPVGVVTTDEHGNVESINQMTSDMFKVYEKDVLEKPVSILFEDSNGSMQDLKAGKSLEQTAKKANGETFPVELTTAEYEGFEGNRLLIHIKDITERKEIEKLKQEFIAMISHDLRTPLTSIGGTLTLIQEGIYGEISDGGNKRVTDAQRNVERLINLVSDLLDLEKLEAGKLTMEMSPCNVSDVIDSSISSVKSYAEQKGIALHAASGGAEISADHDRLVQVLVNLISNAVKFSPVGGNVYVSSERKEDFVILSVKDEGRGIPKEFQDSIFEKFQQVASGDAKRSMGTGLGLAICKAIVESHNGKIGVDSDGKTGSTFWIRLPAVESAVTTL